MEVEQVEFVPKHKYGGYNCRIKVIRANDPNNPERCLVYLYPAEGSYFEASAEDLQLLLGVDNRDTRELPAWVGNVRIERSKAPEHEIQFIRLGKVMGFSEVVKYFEGFTTFKRL